MRDLALVFRKERDDKKNMAKKMRAVQVPHAKGPFEIVEREIPEPQPGWVRIKVQASAFVIATPWLKMGRGQAFNIRAFRDMKSSELLTQSGQALPAGQPANELVLVGMAGTADIAIIVDGAISSRAR